MCLALDALVAWGAWQLPAGPGAFLLALCALWALVVTMVLGLVVAVLSRASVAAGEGWVGYRVLGRWRVVRRVLPDMAGDWRDGGPGGEWYRPPAGAPAGDRWPAGDGRSTGPASELAPGDADR